MTPAKRVLALLIMLPNAVIVVFLVMAVYKTNFLCVLPELVLLSYPAVALGAYALGLNTRLLEQISGPGWRDVVFWWSKRR